MFVANTLQADHKDLIHDITFDFYGRRMATCSSDQSVKVWDLDEKEDWQCTASWKTHSGSVWRVVWAHPEFGQVLATCSFDRTACIWEEQVADTSVTRSSKASSSVWVKRATLVDSRTSVADIAFAPKHIGLQLATCSTDGYVRIYEAQDVMNLSQWQLMNEIIAKNGCSCITWNPSRAHPPMLAVGIDTQSGTGGLVQIYEYNEQARKWNRIESLVQCSDPVHDVAFAPNLGRSYHMLAVASKDVRILMMSPVQDSTAAQTKLDIRQPAQFDDHTSQVWRVEWNITGTILASSGDDGCVRLYKANHLDNWKCIQVLRGDLNPSAVQASSASGSGVAAAAAVSTPSGPSWLADMQQL